MTGHEDRVGQLGAEPRVRVQGVTAGQTSQSGSASVPTRHPKAGLRAVVRQPPTHSLWRLLDQRSSELKGP